MAISPPRRGVVSPPDERLDGCLKAISARNLMAIAQAPPHESKIYSDLSRFYDRIFTNVFYPRIRSTIDSLRITPGSRVLEVGVGTGLSLPAYPESSSVVGVDLAQDMLAQAEEKIRQSGWHHIELRQMDALALDLPDESFDCVTAFHVVSVVPDSAGMMREMLRVCRPGGRIVIINHFRSERRWLANVVDRVDPITRKFGWRTTLRLEDLVNGSPFDVERRFKTSPLSLFTIIVGRKPVELRSAVAAS